MTELWHIDTSEIQEDEYRQFLITLPIYMQEEIKRYRFFTDRKNKLFARILVQNYYTAKFSFTWNDISKNKQGKPFLTDQNWFNISHSGSQTCVAFSSHNIGVDIEKMAPEYPKEITTYFHKEEQLALLTDKGNTNLFYKIWTRKEAFLKAIGLGLPGGLEHWNCLQDKVTHEKKQWNLSTINAFKDYQLSLCQQVKEEVQVKEFKTKELLAIN